jgi:hypothetical protein
MKNFLAVNDLIAVSANLKEAALNTEQTLDTSLLVAVSDMLNLEPRREDNSTELTGKEEPDAIYDLGALSSWSYNFAKAQAQHFALILAYALGLSTPSAWGTGFKHAILPTNSMSNPSLTAAMRLGKTIGKRLFASLFVDTVKASFKKDSWASLTGGMKGTGKYTNSVITEIVNAAYNAASLTLAASGVAGGDAATRLDNVHRIRCVVPATGEWKEVAFTAVSGATPAIITITSPGGVGTMINYEILYSPVEAAWGTFPARVSEPPLRVTDLVMTLGGKWSGAAFLGGRTLSDEIESIDYNLNNQMQIEYRPGGTGSYASYALRQGRQQSLALSRQMRDWILQQEIKDNEVLGVYMKATGPEFEAGKNYFVEMIFPRCGVLKAPVSVNSKTLAEAGDIKVMQDDTYGSVIVNVGNKVTGYAQ